MSDETTLLVPGSGSHKAPTRGGGYLTSEGMFLKMNLKVSQQILHSKEKKKTPFFVPKTVDMLVQHPQGQAINLFFLNKSR